VAKRGKHRSDDRLQTHDQETGELMDVSIIIVNYNTKDVLRDCLESIYEQTRQVHFEVIVVDNASADGSVNMIKDCFSKVILIENSENRGFAAANNQGIKIAKARYLLLLNSDTVILDDAIRKTVEFADSHKEAGILGCRVLNPDSSLQPTCFMFPSLLNAVLLTSYLNNLFPRNRFFGREQMTWWDRTDEREVDVVTGCFMLVRKTAIKQVGEMDTRFFMYAEETDWCYRFKQADWKIMFTPVGEIIHAGGCSAKQMKPKMVLQLRASVLLFFKKHRTRLSYRVACLFMSLFFLLRIPYWLERAVSSHGTQKLGWQMARAYGVGAFKALFGWQALCAKNRQTPTSNSLRRQD